MRDSQSGRKPILLEFVPEGRIGIGVSINHDGIKVALVNLLGEPLYIFEGRASLEHEKAVLAQVEQGIEECIAHAKEQNLQDRIYGIGIGVLGLVEVKIQISPGQHLAQHRSCTNSGEAPQVLLQH